MVLSPSLLTLKSTNSNLIQVLQCYRTEAVVAAPLRESSAAALCFNLPTPPGPSEANLDDAAKMPALAYRLGLPSEYIARIK
jgi:hypothetical protein